MSLGQHTGKDEPVEQHPGLTAETSRSEERTSKSTQGILEQRQNGVLGEASWES